MPSFTRESGGTLHVAVMGVNRIGKEQSLVTKVETDVVKEVKAQLKFKLSKSDLAKDKIAEIIGDELSLSERIDRVANVVPAGAVVAFDLNEGCPIGSTKFLQAQSRSIIGAYFSNEEIDPALTRYIHDSTGGKETIRLTSNQLPRHNHEYKDTYFSEDERWIAAHKTADVNTVRVPGNVDAGAVDHDNEGCQFRSHTKNAGMGNEITIRSPFLALYYCQRDSRE